MRYVVSVFIIWISCYSVGYCLVNDTNIQGTCNTVVKGNMGDNVTITCTGLSEGAIKTLNELLNKVGEVKDLLTLMSEKEKRLAEVQALLSKKDETIDKRDDTITKLNVEKAELEDSLKHLKVGVETAKLKAAEEWAGRFRELQKQLAKLEEQINAMDGEGNLEAKKALSQSAKQAQQQLDDGKLDEAGRLYDELIAKVKEQRIKLKDQLEKQLELMDDLEANASHQRGQVYLLQYQPLQALPFLESAYRLRPANKIYAHNYAMLLQKQNQHAQAITIYEQNLQRLRETGDKEGVAMTLNNLGILYQNTQQFKEGEASYQEALTTYRDLAKANPQAYSSNVALTLNNLGILYQLTQRLKEGEASYQEALTIHRDLAKANPQAYLPDVARTLNNLGLLYSDTQRFKEGEASYQEALTTYRDLAKANPKAYLPDVATVLNNLGNLYSDTQRLKEAEASYQEALTIRRNLAKANPQAYLPDVTMTLGNLGNLYSDTQRLKETEASYQEALTIFRELAKANPQTYSKYVAAILNNLGVLYKDTQRLKEAEASYQEALTIKRELAKPNPQAYLPDVALTLNNLGVLYKDTQRLKEAEASYQEALTIRRNLAKTNPQAYSKGVANILGSIAELYYRQGKNTEAHRYFEEAVPLYRELWQAHPELYAEKFSTSLSLSALTLPQEDTETRCALFKEAWQVAHSAKLKMAVMAQDIKDGAPCKLHNLLLRAK